MNNPEGYVLVQVKQLAQWREWANNVAAWSTKADRSSEVARLKASISSAMISATQPTASNAGERELFEAWCLEHHEQIPKWTGTRYQDAIWDEIWESWQARAALASKPVAPPAREAQLGELLRRARPYVDEAARRFYDGTGGQANRENAQRLLGQIDSAALSATPPAQAVQDSAPELAAWLLKNHPHSFINPENMETFLREFSARTRGNGMEP